MIDNDILAIPFYVTESSVNELTTEVMIDPSILPVSPSPKSDSHISKAKEFVENTISSSKPAPRHIPELSEFEVRNGLISPSAALKSAISKAENVMENGISEADSISAAPKPPAIVHGMAQRSNLEDPKPMVNKDNELVKNPEVAATPSPSESGKFINMIEDLVDSVDPKPEISAASVVIKDIIKPFAKSESSLLKPDGFLKNLLSGSSGSSASEKAEEVVKHLIQGLAQNPDVSKPKIAANDTSAQEPVAEDVTTPGKSVYFNMVEDPETIMMPEAGFRFVSPDSDPLAAEVTILMGRINTLYTEYE